MCDDNRIAVRDRLIAEISTLSRQQMQCSVQAQLEEELKSSGELVARAERAREQLRELYQERDKSKELKDASMDTYQRMKKEYFQLVFEAGQVREAASELSKEARNANTSAARVQAELPRKQPAT